MAFPVVTTESTLQKLRARAVLRREKAMARGDHRSAEWYRKEMARLDGLIRQRKEQAS